MSFGEWLQKQRETLKKTQSQIAEEVGCTQALVSYWESNKAKPDPGKWVAISRAYRVGFNRIARELAA